MNWSIFKIELEPKLKAVPILKGLGFLNRWVEIYFI
jgi:hypothetical protein